MSDEWVRWAQLPPSIAWYAGQYYDPSEPDELLTIHFQDNPFYPLVSHIEQHMVCRVEPAKLELRSWYGQMQCTFNFHDRIFEGDTWLKSEDDTKDYLGRDPRRQCAEEIALEIYYTLKPPFNDYDSLFDCHRETRTLLWPHRFHEEEKRELWEWFSSKLTWKLGVTPWALVCVDNRQIDLHYFHRHPKHFELDAMRRFFCVLGRKDANGNLYRKEFYFSPYPFRFGHERIFTHAEMLKIAEDAANGKPYCPDEPSR